MKTQKFFSRAISQKLSEIGCVSDSMWDWCSVGKKDAITNNYYSKDKSQIVFEALDFLNGPSAKWNKIEFSLSKSPLMYSRYEPLVIENLVSSWGGRLLGCVLSLSPLEEIPEDENLYNEGLPEGAKEKVVVNKYERNRFNRAACIEHHGYACKICSLDFEKTYGSLGAGYIHVHHIVPVSKMGGEYRVDPVKDLVPVCPNCHSMLHRKDPPYTVDEMILQIKNKITDNNKLK